MPLIEALALKPGELACFVGAGGKTGLMLRLASECLARGRRVLVTTSTRMFDWQLQGCGQLILEPDEGRLLCRLQDVLGAGRMAAAGAGLIEGNKVAGLSGSAIDLARRSGLFDYLLVEGDGSRGRPLKAPALHEPAAPAGSACVVCVVGAESIGSPLAEQYVHRYQLAAELAGQPAGSAITGTTILRIAGYYRERVKQQSPGARLIMAVNKADGEDRLRQARAIAAALAPLQERVLITSALLSDPVLEVRP